MEKKLDNNQIEMLRFFCLKLIPDFNSDYYNMPYLKFVFKESELERIIYYLKNAELSEGKVRLNIKIHLDDRYIDANIIDYAINILSSTLKEYNNNPDSESIYIRVPDYKDFFILLEEIKNEFENASDRNNFRTTALLRTIWLRMGQTDIDNVIIFLKRQLRFIKNDFLFNTSETNFLTYNDISISYINHGNLDWFETNRHIVFFLKGKNEVGNHLCYSLPAIHYALIREDEKPTCYIYGIQNLKNYVKDDYVKGLIQDERKRLRNKVVSPDFIIALNLFIKLLESKGITYIKVPLLQVFNYIYHKNIGENNNKKLMELNKSISENNSAIITDQSKEQIEEYEVLCDKFYGKEDIISKNKTERLIETLALVRDYYGSIEFINEPFIEGDTLICSIEEQRKKL